MLQPDEDLNLPFDRGKQMMLISSTFYFTLIGAMMEEGELSHQWDGEHRTDLDSHANMPVVGRNARILCDTGQTASVSPYNPEYETKEIPIVDAAIQYNDPISGKPFILVIRNALYVESLEHNLIPPFVMRENGITVNELPKIHSSDPSSDDHAIIVDEQLRIPLSLYGTFSYFPSSTPSIEEMQGSDDVYLLTPPTFDTFHHSIPKVQQKPFSLRPLHP